MGPDSPEPANSPSSTGDRLDSWKEIAAHLNRHVTTVRRWEKSEGLPVHRHIHDKLGSVYAFRAELDAWWRNRRVQLEQARESAEADSHEGASVAARAHSVGPERRLVLIGGIVSLLIAFAAYFVVNGQSVRLDRHSITSLAVLPLENLSGDPTQDFLADGMTEALIGQLARMYALRVVSRTSSMSAKGSQKPLPEIARALGVDVVVQGSLMRSGNRVRIGVRLIDGRTDAHLWAHDYEREVRDIVKLQSDVARAVGEEIRIQITAGEPAKMASARTVHPASHREYLLGRYHLWRDNDEHLQHAIEHFQRATTIDSQYALAYASLAHAWWKRGLWGDIGLLATETPARVAAQQALHLDDALPEAYVAQADLVRLYDRDLGRAEQLVTRALALAPHNVDAHYTYALLLMTLGRLDEALSHMEAAERLDPLSPAIQSDLGRVLYRARKYQDAIQHLNRALELEPAMAWLVQHRLAEVYEQMGHYDDALVALQRAGESGRSHQALRASILARMGRRHEAKRLIEDLAAYSPESRPYEVAAAYAALADNDSAFKFLFGRIDRHEPGPIFAAVDPPLDSLHSDPRWPELVRRLSTPRAAHAVIR